MKSLRLPVALCIPIVAFAVLLAGCGKQDERTQTYESADGKAKVKVDETGGKITVDSPDGKTTIDTTGGTYKQTVTDKDGKTQTMEVSGKVDNGAFEGFVYPASTPQSADSMSNIKNGEFQITGGAFETADKPDKVLEHYKKMLRSATTASFGAVSTVTGKTPKGADLQIMILAGENGEKTKVNLTLTKKS